MARNRINSPLPPGLSLVAVVAVCVSVSQRSGADDSTSAAVPPKTPLVAIWHLGGGLKTRASLDDPYIKVAIWSDGRVVFNESGSDKKISLRTGRISEDRVQLLRNAISDTQIFANRNLDSYVYIDASFDCLVVDNGRRSLLLTWDRLDRDKNDQAYNARVDREEFERRWNLVEAIAKLACPTDSVPDKSDYSQEMDFWYSKHQPKAKDEKK